MKKVVTVAIILSFWCLYAVAPLRIIAPQKIVSGFTITQPGLYVVRGDAVVTLTSAPAISIQSDSVTLDLNGRSILGDGLAGTAIDIPGAFQNITIKNGIIAGFHQRGISAANGASNMLLQDISITGTSNDSLSFIGLDVAGGSETSQRIVLRNCKLFSGNRGIDVDDVDGVTIDRCFFNNNGNGASFLACTNVAIKNAHFDLNNTDGITIATCNNINMEKVTCSTNMDGINAAGSNTISIKDSRFDDNVQLGFNVGSGNSVFNIVGSTFNLNGRSGIQGSALDSLYVTSCQASHNGPNALATSSFGLNASGSGWFIRDSDFSSNSNTSISAGVRFAGSNLIIDGCTISNNFASAVPASTATGLHLDPSVSCIVRNCVLNGNFSNDARTCGMELEGSRNVFVENCVAHGNASGGNLVSGFRALRTGGTIIFSNCIASSNSGSLQGNGFRIESTMADVIIKNSRAIANSSNGFVVASTTSFLFGNVATGNPTNYTGGGTFSFLTVTNGTSPTQGTFDERMIDNIAIP